MKHAVVLMPTFNGEKYLSQQLDSIRNQIGVNPRLYIRDDASTDSTRVFLGERTDIQFADLGKENLGTFKSLEILLKLAPRDSYIAFADQDDVWEPNHLQIGLEALSNYSENEPAMYFPLFRFINAENQIIRKRKAVKQVGLANSLVENPAIGCGVIINSAAFNLLQATTLVEDLHLDQQIYFLVSLCGHIVQGSTYSVNYRIHRENQVGIGVRTSPTWIFNKLVSSKQDFKPRNSALNQLRQNSRQYSIPSRFAVAEEHFSKLQSGFFDRLIYALNPKFKREKLADQLGFIFLLVMGRL